VIFMRGCDKRRQRAKRQCQQHNAFQQLHGPPVYWPSPMHDLAIRGALLLDGLGSSPGMET